jgi:hypothetical protein
MIAVRVGMGMIGGRSIRVWCRRLGDWMVGREKCGWHGEGSWGCTDNC